MSCYGWERGTIKLPSGEVATVKKAVRDANNALHEKRYQTVRELWRQHGAKLRAKVDHGSVDWFALEELTVSLLATTRHGVSSIPDEYDCLSDVLVAAAQNGRAPRREEVNPPPITNRTERLRVGLNASISFAGRDVTWAVDDNNHSVDRAHEDPVAIAFFRALDRVRWTRGSGGQIVGNDEYNRESDYAGGGGNYVTREYGPRVRRPATRRW